jgi:hypothetical protein
MNAFICFSRKRPSWVPRGNLPRLVAPSSHCNTIWAILAAFRARRPPRGQILAATVECSIRIMPATPRLALQRARTARHLDGRRPGSVVTPFGGDRRWRRLARVEDRPQEGRVALWPEPALSKCSEFQHQRPRCTDAGIAPVQLYERLLSAYFADAGNTGSLPTSRSSCWMMTVALRLAAIFLKRSSEPSV